MAHPTTYLDTEEFLNEFLPYPHDAPAPRDPTRNPFETLQNPNSIPESEVYELVVSRHSSSW